MPEGSQFFPAPDEPERIAFLAWLALLFPGSKTSAGMSLDAASLGARATPGIEARCSGGEKCGLASTTSGPTLVAKTALKARLERNSVNAK